MLLLKTTILSFLLVGISAQKFSPNELCGTQNGGTTCNPQVNSAYTCCSQKGFCGDTSLHCSLSEKCQPAYGMCTNIVTGRCGAQSADKKTKCPTVQCCSEGGYCGTTQDFCIAPGCQMGMGKCDADKMPKGAHTKGVARPGLGKILYGGAGIYDCLVPGEIAITYDDGPDKYTDNMVDLLNSYNAKATFFVTGINNGKGAIDEVPAWANVIKKMDKNGHQIASHTWSHADLSKLTSKGVATEMHKLEMALRNIIGKFPTYMRPPYSSCSKTCQDTLKERGYHITYFDLDTDDYNNVTPEKIHTSKKRFWNALKASNYKKDAFLAVAHDIHYQTANNLTAFMLDWSFKFGYKPVTLGKCLRDPVSNWYRTAK